MTRLMGTDELRSAVAGTAVLRGVRGEPMGSFARRVSSGCLFIQQTAAP
jgi:hypothetical protein